MKRQRILVTGGAGFIGSHLVDRLVGEGHPVIVIDNETTGSRENVNPAADYVQGDITNANDLDQVFRKKPDAVFHIAGQASITQSFTGPEHDLSANVVGTIHVVKKCLEYRVPRLLYASSMVVYGNPKAALVTETEPCIPVSYYGITKYAAERYVHVTSERADLGLKLCATSLRMFSVYGERQSLTNPYQGVFAIFIGNILRNEPITIYSDGEQSRDFVHVSDVVEAWIRALDSTAAHGLVINLGTGRPCSVNRLLDLTLAALGRSRNDCTISYGPERAGDQRCMSADIERARQVLDWKPKVSLDQGMTRTIRWAVTHQTFTQRNA